MPESSEVTNESAEHGVSAEPLDGRWSIVFVAAVFGIIAGLSFVGFLFNLSFNYPGTSQRVIVVDPLWMVGHLVRGFGLGAIAYRLWRYQQVLKHWRSSHDADAQKFAQAHFAAWVTGALALGALVIYGMIYVSFGGPRIAPSQWLPAD